MVRSLLCNSQVTPPFVQEARLHTSTGHILDCIALVCDLLPGGNFGSHKQRAETVLTRNYCTGESESRESPIFSRLEKYPFHKFREHSH